ncbi:MAG TPA: hypothetical protein PLD77_01955 [Candidatus Dojkabacteria bacterium]|nr:hypothetical protein [Candidatus Dojkabacteria bacterium]
MGNNIEVNNEAGKKKDLFPTFHKIDKNGFIIILLAVLVLFAICFYVVWITFPSFNVKESGSFEDNVVTDEESESLVEKGNDIEKSNSDEKEIPVTTNFEIPAYITPVSINFTSEPINLKAYQPREAKVEERNDSFVIKVVYPGTDLEEEILTLGKEDGIHRLGTIKASLFNNSNKVAIVSDKGLFVYDWNSKNTRYYVSKIGEKTVYTEMGTEYEEITWKVESTGQIMKYNDFKFVKSPIKISKNDKYLVSEVVHVGSRMDTFPYSLLVFDTDTGNLLSPEIMLQFLGRSYIQFSNDLKDWVYCVDAIHLRDGSLGYLYSGSTSDFSNYINISEKLKMNEGYDFEYATFSNDNQKIAIMYRDYPEDSEKTGIYWQRHIGILDKDGSSLEILPDDSLTLAVDTGRNFSEVIFSPDDKSIYYFTVSDGNDVLVQYNLQDKKYERVIKFEESNYSWSDFEFTEDGYLKVKVEILKTPKSEYENNYTGEEEKFFYIVLDVQNGKLIYSSGYPD